MTEAVALVCRHLSSPISEVEDFDIDRFHQYFGAMVAVIKSEAPADGNH